MTRQGAEALQEELYRYGESQLMAEAVSVAEDSLAWVASHFELTVAQLEYLRGIPQNLLLIIGCNLAHAIATRRPFLLKCPKECNFKDPSTFSLYIDNSITSKYRYPGELTSTGRLVINFK